MSNINLLPQGIKQNLEQKKKNRETLKFFTKTLLTLVLVIVISGTTWLFLTNGLRSINLAVEKKNEAIKKYGSLEEESKNTAEKLNTIKLIANSTNSWSPIIEEIRKVMPTGTYLSEISMSADTKTRGEMIGFAKTKDSIATLRNTLEDSTYFQFVDIENIATEEDPTTGIERESFTLSFSFTEGALDE